MQVAINSTRNFSNPGKSPKDQNNFMTGDDIEIQAIKLNSS